MVVRTPPSFLKRAVIAGLLTLFLWAAFSLAVPLAAGRGVTLFGLPLGAALALPVALPAFVLIMFWYTARQNRDDERFRDDG